MGWYGHFYPPYVSVAERKAQAMKSIKKLNSKGKKLSPVVVEKRTICSTFWGKSWCSNIEGYRDYNHRLERGRSYLRSGAVIDLKINKGSVESLVSGSKIYKVKIEFSKLAKNKWTRLKNKCSTEIFSMLDLLMGKLSSSLSEILCNKDEGLFPKPSEITFECSCPDYATMCKHVAATMYGIGHRLETQASMLFLLRGVNHEDLISKTTGKLKSAQEDKDLESLFNIELDTSSFKKKVTKKVKKKVPAKKVVKKVVTKKAVKKKVTKSKAVRRK